MEAGVSASGQGWRRGDGSLDMVLSARGMEAARKVRGDFDFDFDTFIETKLHLKGMS